MRVLYSGKLLCKTASGYLLNHGVYYIYNCFSCVDMMLQWGIFHVKKDGLLALCNKNFILQQYDFFSRPPVNSYEARDTKN